MQRAEATGSHNIIVQANGDGISIAVNTPYLQLLPKHRGRRPPRKELDILVPECDAIPFFGRSGELGLLKVWLTDDRPVSVRCLIGRGGAGKTRLAMELCAVAESQGWLAGFLTGDELRRFLAQQNSAIWGRSKPTLVVVDYAASVAPSLRRWLLELLNAADTARPLRILLLERHATPQFGWWREISEEQSHSDFGLEDLFEQVAPVQLSGLDDVGNCRDLAAAVIGSASSVRGEPKAVLPTAGEDMAFDRWLADERFSQAPLDLMMAALFWSVDRTAALTEGRTSLARRFARRELTRIGAFGADRGIDPAMLHHLAACTILAGGCDHDFMLDVIAEEFQPVGHDVASNAVASVLADALPGEGRGAVAAVQPDLIGEAVAEHVLTNLAPNRQREMLERAHARRPEAAFSVMIRIAADLAETDDYPVIVWMRAWVARSVDAKALAPFARHLPYPTVRLRLLAAEFEERLVTVLRTTDVVDTERLSHLAGSLNNLSVHLSDLGRREAALAAIEEAVALRRELSAARPDAFLADLALSVSVLSDRYAELGRNAEAYEYAHDAIRLLSGPFLSLPQVFARLMATLAKDYIEACERAGREVDEALLMPIIHGLKALPSEEAKG